MEENICKWHIYKRFVSRKYKDLFFKKEFSPENIFSLLLKREEGLREGERGGETERERKH